MSLLQGGLRHSEFRLYLAGRFLMMCAYFMFLLAVSQFVYEQTHDPLQLGTIGLILFIPRLSFTLLAGQAADRLDRRLLITLCRALFLLVVVALIFSLRLHFSFWVIYPLLFLAGTANAFGAPATQAFLTQLVPESDFSHAFTWSAGVFQMSVITGPALGGWLYGLFGRALPVFYVVGALQLVSIVAMFWIKPRRDHIKDTEVSWKTYVSGLRYVFEKRLILGAISMDLFAVLLGGAVALLPIYANDILRVGPTGLGLLRAAPSMGAVLMALSLARRPPLKKAGATMFWCVALFGMATVLFGVSKNFFFSLFCLVVLGAADMVSMVVRGVLVQMETPSEMRGRVSAVNVVFIGASNELGEFESGVTARLFGVVPSVVLGGLGTLVVVALWARRFPELTKYTR